VVTQLGTLEHWNTSIQLRIGWNFLRSRQSHTPESAAATVPGLLDPCVPAEKLCFTKMGINGKSLVSPVTKKRCIDINI